MFGAIGGMVVGGTIPFLWGDYNSFDFVNVLTTMAGGFIGIWLAVWLSARFDF